MVVFFLLSKREDLDVEDFERQGRLCENCTTNLSFLLHPAVTDPLAAI